MLCALAWLMIQDADYGRLVDKLGDDNAVVREQSEAELAQAGGLAEEALRRAADHPDQEIRDRVGRLLAVLDRQALERRLEARQRSTKLHLVTLDADDRGFCGILDEISRQSQVGFTFLDTWDHPERVRGLHVQDRPLCELLDRLTPRWSSVFHGTQNRVENPVYTSGGRFSLRAEAWKDEGFIIETAALKDMQGELEWKIASISGSEPHTCAIHSPGKVFVADPQLREAAVEIAGIRRWYCDIPLELDPRFGATRRAGSFVIEVRWPKIVVRSDQPVFQDVIQKMLATSDIQWTLKPGARARYGSKRLTIFRGGAQNVIGEGPKAWCGCSHEPAKAKPLRPGASEISVDAGGSAEYYSIDSIASIRLVLHKPVEEAFSVSTSLKVNR